MSTGNNGPEDTGGKPPRSSGGPSPFTEEEIAAVTGPGDEDELEDSEVATIEADEVPDLQSSFEKLVVKSRNLSPERIRTVVESVLFVAEKPLDLDQLYEATGIEREKIQEALNLISGVHRDGISGIVLYEVSGGWQFRTDPHSGEYVRRYLRVKPQRLTRAAVETLAIIAYRQPVTRPEIEDIRGVDCGAVIKALLDRKLIKILGKKEEVGRPMLYGTTREFLEFFALKDLSALPTLREFHELTQEHQEIVEKERPTAPGASGTVELLADPDFQKRMDKSVAASEAALEELEQAMDAAEKTQKAASSVLNPTPPPPEGDKGPAEPA
ncbi:SMC-Scp complex subunit ScpB [Archangium gephyra]|uniref:SMC-Scp complex subunit ScpB n=1 Tax=Archangium gephyra TaxID=48 RepID=UPI000649DE3A|nr:SMC-Scp complex subunit ScpB [Archangium gephyra]